MRVWFQNGLFGMILMICTGLLLIIGQQAICGKPRIMVVDGSSRAAKSLLPVTANESPLLGEPRADLSDIPQLTSTLVQPAVRDSTKRKAQSVSGSDDKQTEGNAKGTVIVMFDNRPPIDRGEKASQYQYWVQSFKLNALYACTHGYDFIYFLDNSTFSKGFADLRPGPDMASKKVGAMYLNKTIQRSAPWGKLVAVAHALALGYDTVVFIDSDAFLKVGPRGLSIAMIEKLFRGDYRPRGHPAPFDPTASELAKGKAMYVAGDYANRDYDNNKPNTGLHIWHAGPDAWEVLRAWWRTNVFAMEHPYEQNVLLSPEFKARNVDHLWAVLGRLPWQNRDGWPAYPATHMNSFVNKNWRRDFYREAFNWSQPIQELVHGSCPTLESQIRPISIHETIEAYLDDQIT